MQLPHQEGAPVIPTVEIFIDVYLKSHTEFMSVLHFQAIAKSRHCNRKCFLFFSRRLEI